MKSYKLASDTWDQKELIAINKVIDSNHFTMGEKVKEFEKKFCRFFKCKYSVMVNSGSSANLIGIASLFYTNKPRLKIDDEVIVPAISWSTSYYPLLQYGLKLKFVDICPETLNYDLDKLATAINTKTRMIMAVNLLGNPNDFKTINKIIKGKNIIIFEDNCESMGAKFHGKFTGTFGLIGTFSTFFSHHISTMEGGVVTTNNEEIYNILLSLRAHGWTRDLPKKNKIFNKSNDKFYESFNFILPGYNLRPLEMSAAVGIEQLKKLPRFLKYRKKNAKVFTDLFSLNKNFIIQKEIDQSSWFGFSLIIKKSSNLCRDSVIKILNKNRIEVRPIVSGNFLKNPVIKYFKYSIHKSLDNADFIHDNGFFVGNHHYDLTNELNRLYFLLNKL